MLPLDQRISRPRWPWPEATSFKSACGKLTTGRTDSGRMTRHSETGRIRHYKPVIPFCRRPSGVEVFNTPPRRSISPNALSRGCESRRQTHGSGDNTLRSGCSVTGYQRMRGVGNWPVHRHSAPRQGFPNHSRPDPGSIAPPASPKAPPVSTTADNVPNITAAAPVPPAPPPPKNTQNPPPGITLHKFLHGVF